MKGNIFSYTINIYRDWKNQLTVTFMAHHQFTSQEKQVSKGIKVNDYGK